jgi:hypothetical protein
MRAIVRERGITAVRRPLHESSFPVFQAITESLLPELPNAARLFDPESLGVTVIGFSRFDDHHKRHGVATKEIAEKIPSSRDKIEVSLGSLDIYGSHSKHKLGFSIHGDIIEDEVIDFQEEFRRSGTKLRRDPNKPMGELALHICIALMYEDHIGHFSDPAILSALGNIALKNISPEPIYLDKISDK